jgi:hypothetical protein
MLQFIKEAKYMLNRRNIINGASVLLITAILLFTSFAVTADSTNDGIYLTSDPVVNIQPQPNTEGRALLWDQYDTDGVNGLSHADPVTSGVAARALLDDFEIPPEEIWELTDFHSLNLWNTMQPGVGTDFHLEFWTDNGGVPGTPIVTATTVTYSEAGTGRTWFGRPEMEITYIYDPIILNEGRYWIYAYVTGPENCFWMARSVIWGTECWTDYSDMPPMGPGSIIFGTPFDLAFQLTGDVIPPPIPDLSCDGALSWVDIPAGSTVNGDFSVGNIGTPGSTLAWKVESWPTWGTWTFTPEIGTLGAGVWETITVEVVVPDETNKEFTGVVKVINIDDPTDFCEIDVILKTPIAKPYTYPFISYLHHFQIT